MVDIQPRPVGSAPGPGGRPPGPPRAATAPRQPAPGRPATRGGRTKEPSRFHPVQVDLDVDQEVAWWRVLGNPILALPHLVFVALLGALYTLVSLFAWLAVLATGSNPPDLFKFQVAVLRYRWRVISFFFFMRERYPGFNLVMRAMDSGRDPATLSIYYPRRMNRLMLFVKPFMAIPVLLLWALFLVTGVVVGLVGYFAVLIVGKWPAPIRRYLVGMERWGIRITAYLTCLTDSYPGFSFRK